MFSQAALNVTTTALQSVADYTGINNDVLTPVMILVGVVFFLGVGGNNRREELHFHNPTVNIYVNEEEENVDSSSSSSEESVEDCNENQCDDNCCDWGYDDDDSLSNTSLTPDSPLTSYEPITDLRDRGADPYWCGFN